jgi:predicted TIM-barrel enzyme
MGKRFTREEVLARLRAEMEARRPLLVVGAGNGLVARCVEAGGADLIVVYNSGYFRLNGHVSMVGNLPVGDANAIMLEMGRKSVAPATRNIPVVGGVYGVDPTRDMGELFDRMREVGYSGVINFPTVGRIDGQYRQDLEAAGLGFEREVEMIARARARELFSMAYVYTPDDAEIMTRAGVDVIVGHCGLTALGDVGAKHPMALEKAVEVLQRIFDRAAAIRDDVILLSHGGPIATAEEAEYVNRKTRAVGFVGASSIERIPIEVALKETCRGFKRLAVEG